MEEENNEIPFNSPLKKGACLNGLFWGSIGYYKACGQDPSFAQ
jgi:hypothetical protein